MIKKTWKELERKNLADKIMLLPTDTIYGFSALYDDKIGNDKINQMKGNREEKYFINLISDISDIQKFDIEITENQKKFLSKIWPGRVTIIFKNKSEEKISFRIPTHKKLRNFIKKVGPITSTSANISGDLHISKPEELKEVLQEQTDFYIEEGELKGESSTILEVIR